VSPELSAPSSPILPSRHDRQTPSRDTRPLPCLSLRSRRKSQLQAPFMKDSHGAVARRSGGEGAAIQVICLVSVRTWLYLSRHAFVFSIQFNTDPKRSRVPEVVRARTVSLVFSFVPHHRIGQKDLCWPLMRVLTSQQSRESWRITFPWYLATAT